MAKTKRRQSSNHLPLYKSYVFKDKDPAIDELRTLIEKNFGARIGHKHLAMIREDGGPSIGCMSGWFFRDTKRPQNPTLEAAGRAMGYKRVWQKMRENE